MQSTASGTGLCFCFLHIVVVLFKSPGIGIRNKHHGKQNEK